MQNNALCKYNASICCRICSYSYFQDRLLKQLFTSLKHCTVLGQSGVFPSGEMAEMSIEVLKTLFNLLLAPNGSGALLRERTVFEEVWW